MPAPPRSRRTCVDLAASWPGGGWGKKLSDDSLRVLPEYSLLPAPHSAPRENLCLDTVGQAVEMVHCLEDAKILITRLRGKGINRGERVLPGPDEHGDINVRAGEGVGVEEASRGSLFHSCRIDGGRIVKADSVRPTNRNLASLECDIRDPVPAGLDRTEEETRRAPETLRRSCDPRISCSTHLTVLQAD